MAVVMVANQVPPVDSSLIMLPVQCCTLNKAIFYYESYFYTIT